ncbi:MAG: 4Fe-4S dicluster domain-containing protein [Dehalococcoidales bacterium]|nr:4Fe-4S dicluster domain-containing protein [Dehalococcoidales bacterium]
MKRIQINESVCIGCGLCEVYCQLEHSQSKDLIKVFKREYPQPVSRLSVEQREPISFAVQCRHCDESPCVYACLTGALQRDPDTGIVTVDIDRCAGCWTCMLACPYSVIRQDLYQGKIAKCDLCKGREIPACVENCPNEALTYVEEDSIIPQLQLKREAS